MAETFHPCADWKEWPTCPFCGEKMRFLGTDGSTDGRFKCDSCGVESWE